MSLYSKGCIHQFRLTMEIITQCTILRKMTIVPDADVCSSGKAVDSRQRRARTEAYTQKLKYQTPKQVFSVNQQLKLDGVTKVPTLF